MSRGAWLVQVAALAAIVAGAVVLRFLDLGANPGGLYTDEATEAISALRILHDPAYRPIFIPEGGGREALFAYLVAGAFAFFGETTLVLRGTAAAIGVAGVLAIWWAARRFGTVAALVAAAWAGGALWLVCIGRDGMRDIVVPLLEALAFVAVLAWHDRPGRLSAALAGSVVALAALYTYQPLKLLPLLVLAWLAWLRRADGDRWPALRATLLPALAAFLVVASPMLVAAASDPGAYFGRALGVTPLAPGGSRDLLDHALRTLGMFAVTGDPNPRHDVAALPMLGWPTALVGVVGLVRIWRRRRDAAHALVGIALPVFLIPPLIATEGGAPHFLRSLGLAAPVAICVGLGVAQLLDLAAWRSGARWAAATAVAAGIGLVLLAVGSGTAYLGRPVADRYAAYRYDLVAVAEAAGPRDAVILDDYTATVVRFLDHAAPPAIVAPRTRIADPAAFDAILATDRESLARAVGEDLAAGAVPLARDPAGVTVAWTVKP